MPQRNQREIREHSQTDDDREFTPAEIKNTIEELKTKRILVKTESREKSTKKVHKLLHWFTYTIYTVCLPAGCYPRRWQRAKIISIVKPSKDKVQVASKYRIISLINVCGKVVEKLLINSVMHHLYSNNLTNPNQYGFTPKKSTTDATLAFKEYIGEGFRKGHITILINLDVQGALDVAYFSIAVLLQRIGKLLISFGGSIQDGVRNVFTH